MIRKKNILYLFCNVVFVQCLGQYIFLDYTNALKKGNTCDTVLWNTRNLPLNNLGFVLKEKSFFLPFSSDLHKAFYSYYLPTMIKNHKIFLLFIALSLDKPLNSKLPKTIIKEIEELNTNYPSAVHALKIYRQFEKEDTWTQIAQILDHIHPDICAFIHTLEESPLHLEPDGRLIITIPGENEFIINTGFIKNTP